jgi:acetylglutamate kinase
MKELSKAAPYVRMHQGRVIVVKAGGSTIARPQLLKQFAAQLAVIHALGAKIVVVHGGGPQIDQLQRLLGEEPRMVDGRRVTSPIGLRALRLATAGELNGDLAAALAEQGAPAFGVVAGSCGAVIARRRPPLRTSQGVVDFGEVGDVAQVDATPIRTLLDAGYLPVIAPVASDGAGGYLNVNADFVAASLAASLHAAKLVFVTGAPGILRDARDPASLVSSLSLAELNAIDAGGSFEDGMKVKGSAIALALERGVERVHVVSGIVPEALLVELYTTHGSGTLITRLPERAPGHVEAAEPSAEAAGA